MSWQQLPATGKIWVYIPVKADNEPGAGLPVASAEFSLLESYIDVVVEGALDYGETFAREPLATTSDWSNFWLNDRELARRPWVLQPGFVAGRRAFNGEFRGGRETQVAPVSRELCDPLG